MSEAAVMIPFIAAMAAATALTRFLPFWLPRRWLDGPLLRKMREGLPASILLILLVFSLKDVGYRSAPWGLNEAVALAATLGLHFCKRNALLSIGAGTALYMLLTQTGALARLLSG